MSESTPKEVFGWLKTRVNAVSLELAKIVKDNGASLAGCDTKIVYNPIRLAILTGEIAKIQILCNGGKSGMTASICNSTPSNYQDVTNEVLTAFVPKATNSTITLFDQVFSYGPCRRSFDQTVSDGCQADAAGILANTAAMFQLLPVMCCPKGKTYLHENASNGAIPKCTYSIEELKLQDSDALAATITSMSTSFWTMPSKFKFVGFGDEDKLGELITELNSSGNTKFAGLKMAVHEEQLRIGFDSNSTCSQAAPMFIVPEVLYDAYIASSSSQKPSIESKIINAYSKFITCKQLAGTGLWIPELALSEEGDEKFFTENMQKLKISQPLTSDSTTGSESTSLLTTEDSDDTSTTTTTTTTTTDVTPATTDTSSKTPSTTKTDKESDFSKWVSYFMNDKKDDSDTTTTEKTDHTMVIFGGLLVIILLVCCLSLVVFSVSRSDK